MNQDRAMVGLLVGDLGSSEFLRARNKGYVVSLADGVSGSSWERRGSVEWRQGAEVSVRWHNGESQGWGHRATSIRDQDQLVIVAVGRR